MPHGIRPYKITHIILITMASIRTVRKSRLLLESLLLGSFLYVPLRTCGCVCVGSSSVLLSVWVILFFVSLSPPTLFNYIRSLSVFYPFTQFLSLWLCLYVSLSPSLSVCLSLYIYLFIYMCIYMSLFCLYVSLCLSLPLSLSLCLCLPRFVSHNFTPASNHLSHTVTFVLLGSFCSTHSADKIQSNNFIINRHVSCKAYCSVRARSVQTANLIVTHIPAQSYII